MSDDYAHGQRDGLRLALAILSVEEAKWTALLGRSRSRRTNAVRATRHKALQVAQMRMGTALGRLTARSDATMSEELASALERVGLLRPGKRACSSGECRPAHCKPEFATVDRFCIA